MYLGIISFLFDLLSFCFFSWIKASELCCCIRPTDSNTTICQSSNSRLIHLNYEFAFSILHYSFLEFCCRLLVHLYASLIFTSQGIIYIAWGVMWLTCLSFVHECFCFDWETFLGVTNYQSIWSILKLLLMATPFSTCSCTITWSNHLFKCLVIILFSISPHFNSYWNKLLH
jgi:hypothetical protein